MISEYNKHTHTEEENKACLERLKHLADHPEEQTYLENPMWELWRRIEKPRPVTSSDSQKKYFIRDH